MVDVVTRPVMRSRLGDAGGLFGASAVDTAVLMPVPTADARRVQSVPARVVEAEAVRPKAVRTPKPKPARPGVWKTLRRGVARRVVFNKASLQNPALPPWRVLARVPGGGWAVVEEAWAVEPAGRVSFPAPTGETMTAGCVQMAAAWVETRSALAVQVAK
jgi:hypothetical protein